MRYILDDRGYVRYCSNTYITCENKTCTPYEGSIPDGYETIEEWVQNANIRAYTVVDGNLVFDAEEDARLQEEYAFDGKTIFEGKLKGGESVTLSNVKRFIDIYFTINFSDQDGIGKYTIDTKLDHPTYGSGMITCFDANNGIEYYISECEYSSNVLKHRNIGFINIKAGTFSNRNNYNDYYVYRIDTYD